MYRMLMTAFELTIQIRDSSVLVVRTVLLLSSPLAYRLTFIFIIIIIKLTKKNDDSLKGDCSIG